MTRAWAIARCLASTAALALDACTFTPAAPPEQDALAKEFIVHPNASTVYVYRSPFNHFDTDTILYLDGRVVGSALPGTFFRLDINPGRHVFHGTGIDVGEMALETRAGERYFLSLEVLGGTSSFSLVADDVGRRRVVSCCTLLENALPGLRPWAVR